MSFHETRFPTRISIASSGGPERRTEVVVLGSGHEERNTRWADSRRSYNAGYGIKTRNDLHDVIAFFEERRGRLYGFRWSDRTDNKSCPPQDAPSATDQLLGTGDGSTAAFQLVKTYGGSFAPYVRRITKPVTGTVLVALDGVAQIETTDFIVDPATGIVTFVPGKEPAAGVQVSAGFTFDVPVRFDTDELKIDLTSFEAGQIQSIPVVEIRI